MLCRPQVWRWHLFVSEVFVSSVSDECARHKSPFGPALTRLGVPSSSPSPPRRAGAKPAGSRGTGRGLRRGKPTPRLPAFTSPSRPGPFLRPC